MNQPNRTKITIGDDLRQEILSGVNQLADIVKSTLGARGRNVSLPRPYGPPVITKDGVSVAREVYLEDPRQDAWAQLVKQVAIKTNNEAGDGTTTATVLAQAIINEGMKHIDRGSNPVEIKAGIDKMVEAIVKQLEKDAIPIEKDSEQVKHIATISANGDKEIGEIIAKAFASVGQEGFIDVDKSKTSETTYDVIDGFEIESGFISPLFITNFQKKTVEFDNPLIYISDKDIKKWHHISNIIVEANKLGRPLVFIASSIEDEALATLIANTDPQRPSQGKQRLPFAAIQAPRFGKERSDILEDIAIMTGGVVVSDTRGTGFEKVTIDKLGTCEKMIIGRLKTNIVKGNGDRKLIENRKVDIRGAIKEEKDETLERQLKNRLGKLNGAVAIIHVGASSESEVKEKMDRIEDSINATRAAVEEGIVPGGGIALYNIADRMKSVKFDSRDMNVGANIVKKAILEPFYQILSNAGYFHRKKSLLGFIWSGTKGDEIVKRLNRRKMYTEGYDVKEERFVDMLSAGIIDPKKVTRVALENASGVAGLILTTEGMLTYSQDG